MDPIWRDMFRSLGPSGGKVSGDKLKGIFSKSLIPPAMLGRIWDISDHDKDGQLNEAEFMTFMYFSNAMEKSTVSSVPDSLPYTWWPRLEHALASDKDSIALRHHGDTDTEPCDHTKTKRQLCERQQELNDLEKKIKFMQNQIKSREGSGNRMTDQLTSYQAEVKNMILKVQQQMLKLRRHRNDLDQL